MKKSERPCLYFQLKLCPGPCISAVSKDLYLENIKQIELFLKGETEILKNQIKQKMSNASIEQNFEVAAFWRDKLEAIDHSTASQHVLLDQEVNKDIIGYDSDKNYAALVIIHIREGKISNKSSFELDLREKLNLDDEIFISILEQYYQDLKYTLPDGIIIPKMLEGIRLLNEVLKDIKKSIQIRTPLADEIGLMRIASKNALVILKQQKDIEEFKQKEVDQMKKTLEKAKEVLDLPNVPRIIEGFDISNIEGQDATGSMVYFLEGKPYNKYYRHFKIRSKFSPDDVAMMKEVMMRRYNYLLENDYELPDLILVDGGKGQLNAGVSVLKELSIEGVPIIGLAKRLEEIFVPGKKDSIILPKNSSLLKLFQRIRDEAHRFAVRLHKKQRQKRMVGSLLDEIKGIGPATRNKLLKHFGSYEGVKNATSDELTKVVGKKTAENIIKNIK